MDVARFIFNNFITSETQITVSSLRAGMVTAALKAGSGSAILTVSGNYTGAVDREYIVEIDGLGTGEVGSATFRWSDGSGGWNATGVTTPGTPTTLNNGVKVTFASGSGADFAVGDKWYFKGINLFNAGKMIDLDRDHRYRSAALESPNTIDVDMLSAREVSAIVLYDHNLTPSATIAIEMDSAATFDSGIGGAPEYSEAISYNAEKIVHYMAAPTTKRYARISITDTTNGDGFIEIGELYIGDYLELSRTYSRMPSRPLESVFTRRETAAGVRRHRYYNARRKLNYNFQFLTLADMTSLEEMYDALNDRDAGTLKPFWFNEDADYPNRTWLVNIFGLARDRADTIEERYHSPMSMEEVLQSA